jgi:hypothetical protein
MYCGGGAVMMDDETGCSNPGSCWPGVHYNEATEGCDTCPAGFYCPSGVFSRVDAAKTCADAGLFALNNKHDCKKAGVEKSFMYDADWEMGLQNIFAANTSGDQVGCVVTMRTSAILNSSLFWVTELGDLTLQPDKTEVTEVHRVCVSYDKQLCPIGKYQPEAGLHSHCLNCKPGKYTDTAGATECKFCPQGEYRIDLADSACSTCTSYFAHNTTVGNVQEQCDTCLPGTYYAFGGCSDCEAGRFQRNLGSTSCNKCPSGQFQSEAGSSFCDILAPKNTVLAIDSQTGE